MKYSLLLFFSLLNLHFAFGQSTAMDWTKVDCNGISHNCYSELDNGTVLLCEYVMQCATCISAAYYLNDIYNEFEISDPGRVKYYAIDWHTSFTCPTFQSWATDLSCTLFLDGYDEVNYYGGMGMPTVVVLGGPDHKVYFNKLGYTAADNATIKKAITEALNATGIGETNSSLAEFEIYPNPAMATATIAYSLTEVSSISIELHNMLGEVALSIDMGQQIVGEHQYSLNTGLLTNGLYLVQINTTFSKQTAKLLVLN